MAGKQRRLYVASSDSVSIARQDGSILKLNKDEVSEDGNIKKAVHSVEEVGPENGVKYWTRTYDPANPSAETTTTGNFNPQVARMMLKEGDDDSNDDSKSDDMDDDDSNEDVKSDDMDDDDSNEDVKSDDMDDDDSNNDSKSDDFFKNPNWSPFKDEFKRPNSKSKDGFWDNPNWTPFKDETKSPVKLDEKNAEQEAPIAQRLRAGKTKPKKK